jgi:26S proteasome regulatory subunit N8
VPFEEDERDPDVWFLDHSYLDTMYRMFKKINAREQVVGWYHTGPKLRPNDLAINDLVTQYVTKQPAHPVLCVVNVQPQEVELPTEAYVAVDQVHTVRVQRIGAVVL